MLCSHIIDNFTCKLFGFKSKGPCNFDLVDVRTIKLSVPVHHYTFGLDKPGWFTDVIDRLFLTV
jgi:hypothetical protein